MSWGKGTAIKLHHQEIAEQVLQVGKLKSGKTMYYNHLDVEIHLPDLFIKMWMIYTKSLQDHKNLKNILSDCCVLDYFGKIFYGQEKVASHLISNLHGSNFELSSLSINDRPSVKWNPINSPQENLDDDLGITMISPPKLTFPSVTFSTPVRSFSQTRKRTASEAALDDCNGHFKTFKTELSGEESCSNKTDEDQQTVQLSPEAIQTMFDNNMRYLTAYGTIRYPKRVLPSMDLKRIKHHSLIALRGSFCQLCIGFKCDEHLISITNCKIRTIKYSFSSRVTPRNLLKAFNEVEDS